MEQFQALQTDDPRMSTEFVFEEGMQSIHEMQEAKAEQDKARRQEKREHKDKRKVEKLIKFLGYDTTNFTEDELQQLREYIMQTVVLGQQ